MNIQFGAQYNIVNSAGRRQTTEPRQPDTSVTAGIARGLKLMLGRQGMADASFNSDVVVLTKQPDELHAALSEKGMTGVQAFEAPLLEGMDIVLTQEDAKNFELEWQAFSSLGLDKPFSDAVVANVNAKTIDLFNPLPMR